MRRPARLTGIVICCLLLGCSHPRKFIIHRSFYYWKTVYRLPATQSGMLKELAVESLYIKLFDVTWDDGVNKAMPVAQIDFATRPPAQLRITPVVFITNETFQKIAFAAVDTLAVNVVKLVAGMTTNVPLSWSAEVQVDCDWTAATKEKYFQFLKQLQEQSYCKNKIVSATIRLHQLKFTGETGIPPVRKGLLMCYNMGNLRLPQTGNSIIEPGELKKYIGQLPLYPMAVDVALPLFDWWVWFRNGSYKGLIHADQLPTNLKREKFLFQNDSVINGFTFEKGDWIRYENSPPESILQIEELLSPKLPGKNINLLLYSLDENNLQNYNTRELENFFNGLD